MVRAAAVVVLLLFPAVSLAQQAPNTAEYCGDCHRAIFEGWKKSSHAIAIESRRFQDALKTAEAEAGPGTRRMCLNCHSPVSVQISDLTLIRKVSWEGVTCDYCHSIREVSLSGANPNARVDFGDIKSGPSKDAESPAHGTVYSQVHTTSLACAECHDYKNQLGFPVLTTYSEWKQSPQAKEGMQCQSCHMYTVRGNVVDPRVKRLAHDEVNLHEMPGSHSVDQLNRAIKASLSAVREGDSLKVNVKITNAGAGHFVPTGSPLRQLILELRVEPYGGEVSRQELFYKRYVTDSVGSPIHREHYAFLKSAKVNKDTRLAPRETRTEAFSVKAPRGRPARVEVNLFYYYSPSETAESPQKSKFLTLSQLVQ